MAERKINTLFLDDDEGDKEAVSLFALYSSLEIFRVVYHINRVLGLNLAREEDVDFKHGEALSYYPLYHYYDAENLIDFYVVANKATTKPEKNTTQGTLFQENSGHYTFLVPERKSVDYFLKIEGIKNTEEELLKLKTIMQISAILPVDVSVLKSYKNLIFD